MQMQPLHTSSLVQKLGHILAAASVGVAEIGDEAKAITAARTIAEEKRMIWDSYDIQSVKTEDDKKMTGFYVLDIVVRNCSCVAEVFLRCQQIASQGLYGISILIWNYCLFAFRMMSILRTSLKWPVQMKVCIDIRSRHQVSVCHQVWLALAESEVAS
ncbi:hypothetical protein BDR07DRAFT_1402644 [Suillus spraguei]|nr:hypothetical protein BDR07DRAFT_1402644 [Suillus spraguei]